MHKWLDVLNPNLHQDDLDIWGGFFVFSFVFFFGFFGLVLIMPPLIENAGLVSLWCIGCTVVSGSE